MRSGIFLRGICSIGRRGYEWLLVFATPAILFSMPLGMPTLAQDPTFTQYPPLAQVIEGKDLASTVREQGDALQFNFSGADWRSVLTWFAKEANLNLEWRESPEGQFNLKTHRTYSVTESLDIINMHLLARGFTLMRRDEVLVLMKLDKGFDTTLVPRVHPDQLDDLGRFDFVRVSFDLDWLLAEAAVKELNPMLSPHGTLVPLTKTNRIEAMDTADNLRGIRDLIRREESGNSQERLVSEFVLEHTNAAEMIGKLQQLLGLEKPLARMSNGQMQVVREQIALKAEMAKRLGDKGPSFQENRIDVFLVANEQRNSIVANAPPDKIAIIKQAVQALDVPNMNQGARLSEITTMKVYPLNGADPDAVSDILKSLTEIGELHPNSRFSEDDDKQILFAYASLKDHVTITSVMNQLAGSSRSFKVIQLERLKAAYVARSIQTLMGAEVSNTSVDESRGRRGRDNASSSWKGFKVDADLPHNRLLLFATTIEFAQVEELLVKIGERNRMSGSARVFKIPSKSIDETIELLRQRWPGVSDNPLEIRLPVKSQESKDSSTESRIPIRSTDHRPKSLVGFNQTRKPDEIVPPKSPNREFLQPTQVDRLPPGPPVVLRKSGQDELVISSQDPVALEQLESMLSEFVPDNEPFKSFEVTYVSPYSVETKLRQVFGTDSVGNPMPLKFVTDETTRSIMVLGAGRSELAEIQELIQFYDKPIELDPLTERKPRFILLKHAHAESVVKVIKDLYRDFLSATDRDLVPPNGGRSPATPSMTMGLLSMGFSTNANTVVVSAPDYLADEIAVTIAGLDIPDASTVVRSITLDGGTNTFNTMTQLIQLLKAPTSKTQPDSNVRGRSEDRSNQDRTESAGGIQAFNNSGLRSQVAPGMRFQPSIPPPAASPVPRR